MIFLIASIILFVVSLACFAPIVIGILDAYWWLMTERTISTFSYTAGRFEGIFLFTCLGIVIFVVALSAFTLVEFDDKDKNNGDTSNNNTV